LTFGVCEEEDEMGLLGEWGLLERNLECLLGGVRGLWDLSAFGVRERCLEDGLRDRGLSRGLRDRARFDILGRLRLRLRMRDDKPLTAV